MKEHCFRKCQTSHLFASLLRFLVAVTLVLPALAIAGIEATAGHYHISLTTQPKVVPVGQAKLTLRVADPTGKPLDGLDVRALATMPGMSMGEREQRVLAVPGAPGTYAMQAAFAMAGGYDVTVKISGAHGSSSTVIRVNTGQDTGQSKSGGFSLLTLVPWVIGLAIVAFVIVRMRATGQAFNIKGAFGRSTLWGFLLLVAMFAAAVFAINNWRRPGAMTPLDAQGMEMTTSAPPGTTAVRLASVTRGSLADTVSYTGQAVGFVEQDVNPRGTGVIVWMPYYVGERVKKGQVLARLDTSQLDPQLAEKAAMTNMAAQGVGVAAIDYQTALQEVAQAKAELGAKQGMVAEAEAMLAAATHDKDAMVADLAAMQTEVASAEAEVSATFQTAQFKSDELKRSQELFAKGALSRSELQMAESEHADAQAKLRQAQAMVRQTQAKVNAAGANVRKADSMIVAAQKKVRQAQSEVQSATVTIRARESAATSAKKNISKEQAGVAQAKAGFDSAAAQRGYSALKAEVDGVVTQRLISPGVLVNPGQTVLKVAQITPIRLQANVAESDLAKITVGAKVIVQVRDGKGSPIEAKVSSVSPMVDPQARTGVVEVVWPNENGRFLPGQFVTMQIEVGSSNDALGVPVEAVQHPASEPGDPKPYVWVAEPLADAGRFSVRRVNVQLGSNNGQRVAVTGDLKEGQQIVIQGGTYLKEGGEVSAPVAEVATKGPVVEITTKGFEPDTLTMEVGKPIVVTFIRRTDQSCGTEIAFPDLKILKPLPLNQPVEVSLTPRKTGELLFTCGMNMLKGKVIVR